MALKRNYLLDFFKGVAAFGVVLVHFQFPDITGKVLCSVGVAGVILFYLISGYFAYSDDDEKACRNLLKRFKRNLIITLTAVLVYFIFALVREIIAGSFGEWIMKFTDPVLYFRMFVMGDFEVIHGDPLWFMPALLYAYLILYCVHKFRLKKAAYIAMPFLLLLRIGMETYTNSFGADWHLSGNFIVGALPVMLLGHFIASRKDKFTSKPVSVTAVCCILSTLLMFVFVNVKIGDFDISQPFKIWCALSVFILALKLPEKKVCAPIGVLGDRYSLYIYLWHFLIGVIIKDILIANNAPEWVIDWCLPVIVIIVSTAVSAAIYHIKGAVRKDTPPAEKNNDSPKPDESDKTVARVTEMESRLNRLNRWLSEGGELTDAVRGDAKALDEYLRSGLWRSDFEADEAGRLPSDLPRGVLSEDAAYNALTEFDKRVNGENHV